MSSYSGLERGIARFLGRFPAVKQGAKYLYSRLVYLRTRKPYRKHSVAELIRIGSENYESFFGYYDKSPANSRGVILAHLVERGTSSPPSAEQYIRLVAFSADNDELLSVSVCAYNWQQGCRAHWLTDDQFIFNDFDQVKQQYVSRVYSLAEKRQIRTFAHPVQDSFETDYFISLNYRRLLSVTPDYGYRCLPSIDASDPLLLEKDGIWKVDYKTGEGVLLITLSEVLNFSTEKGFCGAQHQLNHVMISPKGDKFIFIHRYFIGQRRFDRLIMADSFSGEMHLLAGYGMVSHCTWLTNSAVLGYLRGPSLNDAYWVINIENMSMEKFGDGMLDNYGDGHPHANGEWFVTDTYPDKARMQHLLLCNWRTGVVKELGDFFHGFEFGGEARCDLHPRFSPDGKAVFFDSVFSGKRQLYRMEL